MNNLLPHQAKLYEQALMYMQGQENMYSSLRTRTAVLEHVRRSFVRSGVHCMANKSKSHRDAHASEGWLQLVGLYKAAIKL